MQVSASCSATTCHGPAVSVGSGSNTGPTGVPAPAVLMTVRHLQRKTVHLCPVGHHLRCVQALRAQKDAAPVSAPSGPLTKAREPFKCSIWHRGSLLTGRRASASRGKASVGLSMLTRPGSIGSVSRRMFCKKKKKSSACLPYLFASLKAFGGHMGSGDVEGAQERPQRLPEGHSISVVFKPLWGKNLLCEAALRHRWSALLAPPPSR